MNFSFKKKKNSSEQETSSPVLFGCPDLDEILEFSLPRGTIISIAEDSPSKMFMSLIRYFIGAGLQLKQRVLVFDEFVEKWSKLVPVPVEKRIRVPTVVQSEHAGKSKIAWRYDEQAKTGKEQAGTPLRIGYPFCDLSKNMSQTDLKTKDFEKNLLLFPLQSLEIEKEPEEESKEEKREETLVTNENSDVIFTGETQMIPENGKSKRNGLIVLKKNENEERFTEGQLLSLILQSLESSLSSSGDHSIKRIVIPSLGGLASTPDSLLASEASLYRFMSDLKTIARSSHCIILLTVPPVFRKLKESLGRIIRQQSDIHITISALPFGSQFSHFSGVFSFDKINSLTRFEQVALKHPSFGVKISKKTLDIEALYETPLDVATEEKGQETGKEQGPLAKNIEF